MSEKEKVYIVFKDSTLYGVYDETKWEEFNKRFKEKLIMGRFTIYQAEINCKCMKIYWNRYTDKWEEDK